MCTAHRDPLRSKLRMWSTASWRIPQREQARRVRLKRKRPRGEILRNEVCTETLREQS